MLLSRRTPVASDVDADVDVDGVVASSVDLDVVVVLSNVFCNVAVLDVETIGAAIGESTPLWTSVSSLMGAVSPSSDIQTQLNIFFT